MHGRGYLLCSCMPRMSRPYLLKFSRFQSRSKFRFFQIQILTLTLNAIFFQEHFREQALVGWQLPMMYQMERSTEKLEKLPLIVMEVMQLLLQSWIRLTWLTGKWYTTLYIIMMPVLLQAGIDMICWGNSSLCLCPVHPRISIFTAGGGAVQIWKSHEILPPPFPCTQFFALSPAINNDRSLRDWTFNMGGGTRSGGGGSTKNF